MRARAIPLSSLLPVALVACGGTEGSVARADTFPGGGLDLGEATGDRVYVAVAGDDRVAVLDVAEGRFVGSAPVGRNPVELDGAVDLAADRAGGMLYLLLDQPDARNLPAGSHAHSVSRASYVQKLTLGGLSAEGEVRLDPDPVAMALSDDGRRLVVTHSATDGSGTARRRLSVVDTSVVEPWNSPEPLRFEVCPSPGSLAVSRPDGRRAYVVCAADSAVAVVDTEAGRAEPPTLLLPEASEASDASRFWLSMGPSGSDLAVTDTVSMDLRRIDTGSLAVRAGPWSVPGAFRSTWSPDGDSIAVTARHPDSVALLDAATGELVGRHIFEDGECESPLEAAFGSGAVYVLCDGGATNSAVVALDVESTGLLVAARFDVDGRAAAFEVVPP